jgi:predicted DNA-binding transcriptional regulator YafY
MRADRLISLLMLLQTHERLTAEELATRLEVSTRTIYRDLDALSASGVPVYAERGPQGGCMLLDSYRTNLTGLTEPEVRALFMFTVPGLLAELGAEKASDAAMLKLTASLPAPFRKDAQIVQERLLLDPKGWFLGAEPTPFLNLVQQAVFDQQRLNIQYRRADGQWVKRLIDPLGLVAKGGIWYLVAGMRGDFRQVFRVSRIQEVLKTGTTFERPQAFNLETYWREWCAQFEARQSRYTVTCQVPPGGEPALRAKFGDGILPVLAAAEKTRSAAGHLTVELHFDGLESAVRDLLGLGTAVTVITPAACREALSAQAMAISAHYNQPRSQ